MLAPSVYSTNSGSAKGLGPSDSALPQLEKPAPPAHSTLSQFAATALSGNDLTSSALYVVSISFAQAGWLAPVCLLLVAALLYAYRFIYSEVGSALPVNGGTYTALLHTTTKGLAATAATLSLLSYAATAVVSGTDAVEYLTQLFGAEPQFYYVVGLLLVFCLLTVYGIGESAMVAIVMFVAHLVTLVTLIGFTIVFAFGDGFSTFAAAFSSPLPSSGGAAGAIFFGFGAALLGVSGFESSSNMIESIAPGQYPYVLRNMHIIVSVLNPLLALGTMAVLPMAEIQQSSGALLATVALRCGGPVLQTILGIDAFVVLSGAVLTAFVGVSGLMERMAQDECLPQLLLSKNTWRNTAHNIPIAFFLVTASLSLALGVDVDTLSGVYTISFLCVMQLFAIGALLLKRKRPSLPRTDRTRVRTVVVALLLTFAGLLANLLGKPDAVQFFLLYAMAMGAVVFCTFQRASILRVSLPGLVSCLRRCSGLFGCRARRAVVPRSHRPHGKGDDDDDTDADLHPEDRLSCPERWLLRTFREASNKAVVFFAKHADLVLLNKAVLYVRDNEQASRVVVVHAVEEGNTGQHARQALARMQLELWTGPGALGTPQDDFGSSAIAGDGSGARDDFGAGEAGAGGAAAGASSAGRVVHPLPVTEQQVAETGVMGHSSSLLASAAEAAAAESKRASPTGVGNGRESELRAASAAGATVLAPSTVGSCAGCAPIAATPDSPPGPAGGAGDGAQLGREMPRAGDGRGRLGEWSGPEQASQIAALGHAVRVLDVMYPKIRLDLLVVENMPFGPGLIRWLESSLGILSNSMFIACPDEQFAHRLGSLGGVRVISRPSRSLDGALRTAQGVPAPRVPILVPSPAGTDLSGMTPMVPMITIPPMASQARASYVFSDLTSPPPLALGVGEQQEALRRGSASPGRLNATGSATALLSRGTGAFGGQYGLGGGVPAPARQLIGGSLRSPGLARPGYTALQDAAGGMMRPLAHAGGFGPPRSSKLSLFSEIPTESLINREASLHLAAPGEGAADGGLPVAGEQGDTAQAGGAV